MGSIWLTHIGSAGFDADWLVAGDRSAATVLEAMPDRTPAINAKPAHPTASAREMAKGTVTSRINASPGPGPSRIVPTDRLLVNRSRRGSHLTPGSYRIPDIGQASPGG